MAKHDCYDFAHIGGMTYFIYSIYLVLKIKNRRLKNIILGVLSFLFALCIGISLFDISEFILPTALLMNLITHTALLIKNRKSKNETEWKTFLINFLVALILSFFGVYIWFLCLVGSAMPSNHY
jgi:uncharacterized membrane protein YfcA